MHKLAQVCFKLLISIHFLHLLSLDIFTLLALNDVLPRCAPQRSGSLDPDSTRSRARADITTQLVVQRMTYEPGRSRDTIRAMLGGSTPSGNQLMLSDDLMLR